MRQRLDDALLVPLSAVVAQAGSGKSVLLQQWVAAHPETTFVWVDITDADEDPAHFVSNLVGALTTLGPGFSTLASLSALGHGGLGVPFLDSLVTELSESGEVVVILDDLHLMPNPDITDDLALLAQMLPPNAHMVISSRGELPRSFRQRDRLGWVEIRQRDLAVTFAESSELLKRVTGRTIPTENVRALVDRTEGWVAGLLIAGVTLRTHDDPDEFVAQFTGSDRLVADYLAEEVLLAQSPADQAALLRMAVLDQMSSELISHLFGSSSAPAVFDELERTSMFVVPLDTRREWFRFHHLFGAMLRQRVHAADPGAEHEILLRASDWHLNRGDTAPAVEYLLRARDWDDALAVVLSRGSSVFERGEMDTVIRWIEQIPDMVLADRPDVTTIVGILKGVDGKAVEAEDILRKIAADPTISEGLRVCVYSFIASLAQWRARPDTSIRNAVAALDLIHHHGDQPVPNLLNLTDIRSLETIALFSGGRAHFLNDNMAEARTWLTRALASDGAAYSLWRISALGSLALVEAWCGSTVLAEELADEALSIAQAGNSLAHPSIADAYLAKALVNIERSETGKAALDLHEATVRAEGNARTQLLWVCHHLHERLNSDEMSVPKGPRPPVVVKRSQALRAGPTVLSPAARIGFVPPLRAVEDLIAQSAGADAARETARSRDLILSALRLAEPHQLSDVFIRAGTDTVDRVKQTSNSPLAVKIHKAWSAAIAPPTAQPLAHALTVREVEILAYLPTRLTAKEMGELLFLSPNTIKTHLMHIYAKLGVSNRSDAITEAHQIGLLQPT